MRFFCYSSCMQETIGQRIARLRQELGWTQQFLAERLAISRVAVSHLEMDLTIPGERTVTLLAGVFKQTPLQLVEDTTYPIEKAERLPHTACCFTPLELDLLLFENDMRWIARLKASTNGPLGMQAYNSQTIEYWRKQIAGWSSEYLSEDEKGLLAQARETLRQALKGG